MIQSLEVEVLYPAWWGRRSSEVQRRCREAGSERSAEQSRGLMDKNRITIPRGTRATAGVRIHAAQRSASRGPVPDSDRQFHRNRQAGQNLAPETSNNIIKKGQAFGKPPGGAFPGPPVLASLLAACRRVRVTTVQVHPVLLADQS